MFDILVCCTEKYLPYLNKMIINVPEDINIIVSHPIGLNIPKRCISVPVESSFTRGLYLNRAALKATSDYILIADSDFLFIPYYFDFLKKYTEIKKDKTYANSYVYMSLPNEKSFFDNISNLQAYAFKGNILPSQNPLLISRKYFIDVLGGYDERMQGWGAEDDDLENRMINSGLKRVRLPLIIIHQNHDDMIFPVSYKNKDQHDKNVKLMRENSSKRIVKIKEVK